MKKIIISLMIGVFMLSFVSAGWFDWIKGDDKKTIEDSIDDTWIKTIKIIYKWKEDLKFVSLKDRISIDEKKKLNLGDNSIVIKENKDGVKVIYNER